MNYNYKSEAQQAFDTNKLRLRLEGRIVLNRIMNEVLREMTQEFQDALLQGEILTLGGSASETQEYFTTAARKALGSGA
jgi:precorrin-6B methylase 2